MGKHTKASSWVRRKPSREPYEKVLIVCEGEKTEPNYFNGLKNHLRLNSANVEIVGEGATPVRIIERAKELDKQEQRKDDAFDKVFCVFDKDKHPDYQQARSQCSDKNYTAITSVPAFEYWLLLHYFYTTRPYQNSAEVLHELKQYMPNYQKNSKGLFDELQDKLENAKKNARRSLKATQAACTDNPSTHVHTLVQFLETMQRI